MWSFPDRRYFADNVPTRTENKGENILPDGKTINPKPEERKLIARCRRWESASRTNQPARRGCTMVNLYWGFTPVAQILHDLCRTGCYEGNDANAAAPARRRRAAAGAQNVIPVTLEQVSAAASS